MLLHINGKFTMGKIEIISRTHDAKLRVSFMVFNATFNNISVWRSVFFFENFIFIVQNTYINITTYRKQTCISVLLVKETTDQPQIADKLYRIRIYRVHLSSP